MLSPDQLEQRQGSREYLGNIFRGAKDAVIDYGPKTDRFWNNAVDAVAPTDPTGRTLIRRVSGLLFLGAIGYAIHLDNKYGSGAIFNKWQTYSTIIAARSTRRVFTALSPRLR